MCQQAEVRRRATDARRPTKAELRRIRHSWLQDIAGRVIAAAIDLARHDRDPAALEEILDEIHAVTAPDAPERGYAHDGGDLSIFQ